MDWAAQVPVATVILLCDINELISLPGGMLDVALCGTTLISFLIMLRCLQPSRVLREWARLVHREIILARIGDVVTASDQKLRRWHQELRFVGEYQAQHLLWRNLRGDDGPLFTLKQVKQLLLRNKLIQNFHSIDFAALLDAKNSTETFTLPSDGSVGDVGALAVANVLRHFCAAPGFKEIVCTGSGIDVVGARALGSVLSGETSPVSGIIFSTTRLPVHEFLGREERLSHTPELILRDMEQPRHRPEADAETQSSGGGQSERTERDDEDHIRSAGADNESDSSTDKDIEIEAHDDTDSDVGDANGAYQEIDYSRKRLCDADVSCIAQFLQARVDSGRSALDMLDLSENEVTDVGIEELVQSEAVHRVCALSIKNNLLSSKASRAIGDSLLQHEHSQLRYFVCSHWQITETSA